MKIKYLAIFLAIALVVIEIYLITSSIIDKYNNENIIRSYCETKCVYNPASFLWEFSGENIMKGYTTREECFVYCGKVKQGFVFNFIENFNYASVLDSIKNIFSK